MWKNRIGYAGMVLALTVLLYFFGRPFLLEIIVLMLVLPVLMAVLLKRDAHHMQIQIQIRNGGKTGRELPADLRVLSKKRLLSTGSVQLNMKIRNVMFGTEETKRLVLGPVLPGEVYQMKLDLQLCGETAVQCESVKVYDLLKLFSAEVSPFQEVHTVIYPKQVNLNLELETRTVGVFSEEGMIQNRKGNDPSEMYDIREYVPGDDIRAIHWKLSSKTEELILRQPSASMHYQVALMPDFCKNKEYNVTAQEWNTAAAVLIAAGEQLLKKGVSFCLLIPENGELKVIEIGDRRMFRMALSQWLGSPVQERSAEGVRSFQSAHMEQYFTRLLIVGAGKEYGELEIQLEQVRMVCFIATEECRRLQVGHWKNSMLVAIPASGDRKETWHVIC